MSRTAAPKLLHELHDRYPLSANEGHLRGTVLVTLRALRAVRRRRRELRSLSRDERHFEMLQAAGLRSAMWIPLIVRERVLGVLSVGYSDVAPALPLPDLDLLRELSRRVPLAIDNALLYRAVERAERTPGGAGQARASRRSRGRTTTS